MKFCCFVLALSLIGCASPNEPVTTTTTPPAQSPSPETPSPEPPTATIVEQTPPPTTTQPPATPRESNVHIDQVTIANPIVIAGRARTFEQNVALRVRDSAGKVIAEDFTTSTGELGHFNPYRGEVWLTSDPGARVTVEALEYSAKDGSEQSVVSITRLFTVALIDAQLHFGTAECAGTVVAQRRLPKSISHARLLAEALLDGPTAAEKKRGMTSPFPQGARVRSVNLRDGVLTIDFNESMQNVGGSCRAQLLREMITKTLMTLPNVKRVVITAAGSEKLALQP